jgi:hypothetical protein
MRDKLAKHRRERGRVKPHNPSHRAHPHGAIPVNRTDRLPGLLGAMVAILQQIVESQFLPVNSATSVT